ncbi:MAG: sulfurtransferase [Alphaproteobacteria bacterium]|nr:MAG: sulfurtransferase [Alphaproteobacteria bacterium]
MESLVSTDWLASELGTANLVVIDASNHLPAAGRDAHSEYLAAHIPTARFLDLASLVDKNSPVPAALPRPEQLAQRLAELGVRPGDRIVLYDDSAVKTSARAWFLLRAHGIDSVAILDGGLARWKAEGRKVETGALEVEPSEPASLPAPERVRFKSDMLANMDDMREQVLDARDPGRFMGKVEDTVHNLPSGHIPGSCNLPFGNLFTEDGTFKTREDLRAHFEAVGIDLNSPIVTTCGSGVTASVLLFALHLIGHDAWALYDGSWLDWGSDPDTPKATVSL